VLHASSDFAKHDHSTGVKNRSVNAALRLVRDHVHEYRSRMGRRLAYIEGEAVSLKSAWNWGGVLRPHQASVLGTEQARLRYATRRGSGERAPCEPSHRNATT
jgi:hypothetical protein